jgi:putative membrane protein
MIVIATLFVALAAVLHVLIFVMESVLWSRPGVWKRFAVPDQAAADAVRPMAYNQGFYNLFLAIGALVGIIAYGVGEHAIGLTLVFFTLACMVLAAVVLVSTGARYVRAALIQGILPLVAIVLIFFSDPLGV